MSLADMESGECRWIGRRDIHVYCRAPLRQNAEGCWQRSDPQYCVVCPAAGLRHGQWGTADEARAAIREVIGGDE